MGAQLPDYTYAMQFSLIQMVSGDSRFLRDAMPIHDAFSVVVTLAASATIIGNTYTDADSSSASQRFSVVGGRRFTFNDGIDDYFGFFQAFWPCRYFSRVDRTAQPVRHATSDNTSRFRRQGFLMANTKVRRQYRAASNDAGRI